MFDRVTDLAGGSGSSGDADPGPIADLLDDEENLSHVLANDGTIEYTKNGRTTKVEPSGDHRAYALVTDERVLFVLGDQKDEIEIEIRMVDLTASHVRSGLLSSKLVVKTDEEEVVFDPDEGDLEEAEAYIDRVGGCWVDMAEAFTQARQEVAAFEERCAEGREPREMALSAQSHLSKARHAATRIDEAPTQRILSRIEDIEVELQHRRVEAWIDRIETRIDQVTAAVDDGTWDEDALLALVDGDESVSRAREAANEVDHPPEGVEERIATLEDRVNSLAERFLADAEAAISGARGTDPPTAADHWATAGERYRAAVDVGWDGPAGVSQDALEYQLAWVEAKHLDTLASHARDLEQEGDEVDDPDRAQDRFETAEGFLERAVDVAENSAAGSPDELETALDRVEEKKLEHSGWEFGKA